MLPRAAVRHDFLEFSLRLVSRLELPPIYFVLASGLIRHCTNHFRHLNVRATVVFPVGNLVDGPRDGVIILANVGISQGNARDRGNRINVLLVNQAWIVDEPVKDQTALRLKRYVPECRTHVLERQRIVQHGLRLVAKAIFIGLHDKAGQTVVCNIKLFHEDDSRPVNDDAVVHLDLVAA